MLILIISLITFILIFLSYIVSDKKPNKEKCFIFECGFNPISRVGIPFSIRFFIIAILFLVFDLEVILLFPFFIIIYNIYNYYYFYFFSLFLIILVLGLVYEWFNGGLEWD